LGVGVATYGDYYFTAWGFFLTVLGTVLSAFKGVVTNQVQVGELKLHPMDLLMRMAPLACVQTFIASYYSGELERMSANFDWTFNAMMILAGNGILAFSMNLVSFTANKKTSALTMGVAGGLWARYVPTRPNNADHSQETSNKFYPSLLPLLSFPSTLPSLTALESSLLSLEAPTTAPSTLPCESLPTAHWSLTMCHTLRGTDWD
jgi:hypothetical protein